MTESIENKRKAKRFSCEVPVDSKSGSKFDGTQTVDICRDGIGFVSDHEIAVNESIAVEVTLEPEGDPVLVKGVVRWARPMGDSKKFRIGMIFSEVINGSRRQLNVLLKDRLSLADIE